MEFVLIDNNIITAHTERVSRLSKGVHNLQEKMSRIMGYSANEQQETVQEEMTFQSEPAYTETPVYNEPVVDDMGGVDYTESAVEDSVQSFEPDHSNDAFDLDGDLDLELDLDKMIADMRFDDDELGL